MYKNIKADNLSEFIAGLGNLSDSDFEEFLNEIENGDLKLDSEIDAILNATGLENLKVSELVKLHKKENNHE